MIWLYSGTPGSGKSYHAILDIVQKLKRKTNNHVIANFPVVTKSTDFVYVDNSDLTISYLLNFAKKYHKLGIEGQTLVVVDEAQCLFNCRDWGSNSNARMDWIKFFSQHRKLGFNFILVAQYDRMIDKQIRFLIEYEISHKKINNFWRIVPFTAFLCVSRWYGQKMKMGHEVKVYRKKIANMYNSYVLFDDTSSSFDIEG